MNFFKTITKIAIFGALLSTGVLIEAKPVESTSNKKATPPMRKTAAAHSVQIPSRGIWSQKLKFVCLESARKNNVEAIVKDVEKGCDCIIRNIFGLASYERSSGEALADVKWAYRYYAGTHSDAELDRDSLKIADFLLAFSEACIENSNYVHDF